HIGLHHLPNWLRRYRREYPQVDLHLQFMESDAAYDQMNKRNAELAFVTLSDSMNPEFSILAQWPDPMAFVVGKEHPLATLASPELSDLAPHPALLPDTSTATYRVVSRLFLEANLTLRPLMPTNYLETIKMMVSVGLGWSILPVSMLDNSLKVLEVPHPVTRVLGAVALSRRQLGSAAQALLQIVEEEETRPESSQ
ncbi:MAG: LysR family transcriptional regulator substrate-binding protein, partial [Pseudomonadota bacterium]|nr:LysR family transcriptional regulator substrate-binding protein [Pseudomonadota bacterium]